ncbi:hypothetical protein DH09_08210 [Bacillaceae bacterium JMAK1]|nr:hypothetical protein DH09_08210 [Bacillaceae bacterium JMAK1]
MSGRISAPGAPMHRPGTYTYFHNAAYSRGIFSTQGVVAAVLNTSFGEVGGVTTITDADRINELIGPNKEAELSFTGGTQVLHVVRVGEGGKSGTVSVAGVDLETKYPTNRAFNVTIRDGLAPDTKDFILFEGQRTIERFNFGSSGGNVTDTLISVINHESKYLNAKKKEGGDAPDTQQQVVNEAMSGGENPTITAGSYADAMKALDKVAFLAMHTDSTDMQIHASLQAYVARRFNEGLRCFAVVGEDLRVRYAQRRDNAKSFDNFQITYVGNGFLDEEGNNIDGSQAVAYVAAEASSVDYNVSLTHKRVPNSTGVVSDLTLLQYDEAATSGMLVFAESEEGTAMIDYGINTKTTFDEQEDIGWNKLRRMRTRYELMDRLVRVSNSLIERGMDTNDDGRAQFIAEGNEVIQEMAGIQTGEVVLSRQYPPQGDKTWYDIINIEDLDSIEKYHLNFGFSA